MPPNLENLLLHKMTLLSWLLQFILLINWGKCSIYIQTTKNKIKNLISTLILLSKLSYGKRIHNVTTATNMREKYSGDFTQLNDLVKESRK